MQFADSLKDSANNPAGGGNLAGDAMGAGIGLAMAGQMAGQMMNPQAGQFHGGQQPPQQSAPTPPPMPQQTTYHVAVGGVQQGPFPVSQLQQMIQQGQLTRDTLVWTAGMPAWAAANSVQELSQLFGAVPPPL